MGAWEPIKPVSVEFEALVLAVMDGTCKTSLFYRGGAEREQVLRSVLLFFHFLFFFFIVHISCNQTNLALDLHRKNSSLGNYVGAQERACGWAGGR